MSTVPERSESEIQVRLRRIEGQIRGIIGMLADGKSCEQVVTQMLAARAAMDGVTSEVLKCHIAESLSDEASPEAREAVLRAVSLLVRVQA
jgi:DNA-binding FrmR family transcriptional regulator